MEDENFLSRILKLAPDALFGPSAEARTKDVKPSPTPVDEYNQYPLNWDQYTALKRKEILGEKFPPRYSFYDEQEIRDLDKLNAEENARRKTPITYPTQKDRILLANEQEREILGNIRDKGNVIPYNQDFINKLIELYKLDTKIDYETRSHHFLPVKAINLHQLENKVKKDVSEALNRTPTSTTGSKNFSPEEIELMHKLFSKQNQTYK